MKKLDRIGRPCATMTGLIHHQLCFLESLYSLNTQGCRIIMLELIPLIIVELYNTQNDVGQSDLKVLQKIEKYISKGKFIRACHQCLKTIATSTGNTHIYKILAHIINCYMDRFEVFTSSACTETDYLAKIWMEIFELLFAKDIVKVKWGESTSQKTAEAKLTNNNNVANAIGLTVDARFITKAASNEPIALSNLEA